MTVNVALVAAIIIMILLITFSIIILVGLTAAAGIRIRSDMVKLVSSYDKIIERKSRELNSIKKEMSKLESKKANISESDIPKVEPMAPPANKASVLKKAKYRAKDFKKGYGAIRDSFKIYDTSKEEIIRAIQTSVSSENIRGDKAASLRNILSFNTVFELSEISSAEQLEILDSSLNYEDWTLLRDYCEEYQNKEFDICKFYDWLKEIANLESSTLTIRCGDYESSENGVEYCSEICEGLQVALGNRLYDYSIKEREIS